MSFEHASFDVCIVVVFLSNTVCKTTGVVLCIFPCTSLCFLTFHGSSFMF